MSNSYSILRDTIFTDIPSAGYDRVFKKHTLSNADVPSQNFMLFQNSITTSNAYNGFRVGISNDTNATAIISHSNSAGDIVFGTSNNRERMRIVSTGRIGIGLSNPQSTTQVQINSSQTAPLTILSTSTTCSLALQDSTITDNSFVRLKSIGSNILCLRANSDTAYAINGRFSIGIGASNHSNGVLNLKPNTGTLPLVSFDISSNIGVGSNLDTSAIGTYYGKIMITIPGIGNKYIALYNS